VPWCLDSGGFSELSLYGRWVTTPDEYIVALRRYKAEVGKLVWAAPMDWMVEPIMRERTGLTVREHQYRTVENVVTLRQLAPDLPIIPVLQGWSLADYLACVRLYDEARIDLRSERIVGLGSVCRRQSTEEIGLITERLSALGLQLHGFGVKSEGLKLYGQYLASADSMAWSFRGRHVNPCAHGAAQSEANCLAFALEWRKRLNLE